MVTQEIDKIDSYKIAKYFIWKSKKESKPITNKKLQKLLYYSQAWNLAINEDVLFEENIEAWVHGPAIKSIYDKFRIFGFRPIEMEVNDEDIELLPNSTRKFLDEIWRVYGKYDANYLEILTHNELPWQKAREGIPDGMGTNTAIDPEDMKIFYKQLLDEKRSENSNTTSST